MNQFILFIHVFAAVCIIALVLVQQGKGATMGAAFGSGASQTVFGSRGSGSFLFRITISLVAVFFITSIAMNYLSARAFKTTKVINLPATSEQNMAKPLPLQPPVVNTPAQIPATSSPVLPSEIPARKATK